MSRNRQVKSVLYVTRNNAEVLCGRVLLGGDWGALYRDALDWFSYAFKEGQGQLRELDSGGKWWAIVGRDSNAIALLFTPGKPISNNEQRRLQAMVQPDENDEAGDEVSVAVHLLPWPTPHGQLLWQLTRYLPGQ